MKSHPSYKNNYSESETKLCSKCGCKLPLEDYYKDNDKWDGYKTICKICYKQYYRTRKDIKAIQEQEYLRRKSIDWIPIRGKYYRYRETPNQRDEDTIIMKIISISSGKYPYKVIDFEPIKSKTPYVTQMVVPYWELYAPWRYQEISEHEARTEGKRNQNKS
jgi:hypothetical protein